MIKKIVISLAVTLFAILIAALFQSDSYRVERSITIAAPPAALFAQVNDLRKAQVWSPWVKLDPAAKYTFEGPTVGVGSSNSWAGNNDVGEGRLKRIANIAHALDQHAGLWLDFLCLELHFCTHLIAVPLVFRPATDC